jgi:hypothetical protein
LIKATRQYILVLAVAALAVTATQPACAYETDQHSNRDDNIADSTEVLNREVNHSIAEITGEWRKGHDEMAVVNAIYRDIGGLHWVDKLERWAMKSPDVEKLQTPRYGSVFSDKPFWATRVTSLFGTGRTIRVNGQLIGTDKIGHFISQGRKYYRRYRKSGSEEQAAGQAAFTERAIFGRMSNGIYSNADLVANYEGHRFYRSLFEDGIIPGKAAILRWENGAWIVQRPFDWSDHVNEYWDEALNNNHYDGLLYRYMHETFVAMCPAYWANPELYKIPNEESLKARYAHLQLRDTSELRLDSLCPVQAYMDGRRDGSLTAEKSSPDAQASP